MTVGLQEFTQQVLTRSDAPLVLKQLQGALAEEQKHRRQFYEDITEDQKAEFINGQIIIHSPVNLWDNKVGNRLLLLVMSYVDLLYMILVLSGRRKLPLVWRGMIINLTSASSNKSSRNIFKATKCFFQPQLLSPKYFRRRRLKTIGGLNSGIMRRMVSASTGWSILWQKLSNNIF